MFVRLTISVGVAIALFGTVVYIGLHPSPAGASEFGGASYNVVGFLVVLGLVGVIVVPIVAIVVYRMLAAFFPE